MSKTLDRIKETDSRVDDVEDLGPDEESRYWIHLKSGFRSPMDDSHTISAVTVREAVSALRIVEPCDCDECQLERDLKREESPDAGNHGSGS